MKHFSFLKAVDTPIYIELRGRGLLLSQGYCRISEYTETEIRLESEREGIRVIGDSLTLVHLSRERVAIKGRIDKVEFV